MEKQDTQEKRKIKDNQETQKSEDLGKVGNY